MMRALRISVLGAAVAFASAPSAARADAESTEPAESTQEPSLFRMATGVDYRRIHDFGVIAGDLEASLRLDGGRHNSFLNAGILLGDTEYQLTVVEPYAGVGWEWVAHRFRFGLGAETGLLSIARATEHTPAVALFAGITGYVSCDLTAQTPDRGTPFVLARFTADDVIGAYPWPVPWGPSLLIGYRF